MTSDDYKKAFGLFEQPKADRKEALRIALDIRKFEIELYWKRAAYFWAFIAAAMGGYFAVFTAKDLPFGEKGQLLLIASSLGVVFSVAWYFVNRASKFWQENWEKQVDLLENAEVGPIYKTVLSKEDYRFLNLWGAYPFSVSKLNHVLSLFVLALFALLWVKTLSEYFYLGWPPEWVATAMVVMTLGASWFLFKARTDPIDENKPCSIKAELRSTKLV